MWCVPYEEFIKNNESLTLDLKDSDDITLLTDIYIKTLNACFRTCEEYDSQHEDDYEDDDDYSMFILPKLEELLLDADIYIINDDWGWLGPYDNYCVDDNGDIIFYSPMYHADGTFVENKDKYGIYIRNRYLSSTPKKVNDKFVYEKEYILKFKELINNILNLYIEYADKIIYD